MSFGPIEAVVIVVIVLVIFGAGRLTGVGKALGMGLREFRQEASIRPGGDDDEAEKDAEGTTGGAADAAGESAAAEAKPAETAAATPDDKT